MPLHEVEFQVIYDRTAKLQDILTAWGKRGWEQSSLDCDTSASGNITDAGRMRLVLKRVTDIPVELRVNRETSRAGVASSFNSTSAPRSTVPEDYSFHDWSSPTSRARPPWS